MHNDTDLYEQALINFTKLENRISRYINKQYTARYRALSKLRWTRKLLAAERRDYQTMLEIVADLNAENIRLQEVVELADALKSAVDASVIKTNSIGIALREYNEARAAIGPIAPNIPDRPGLEPPF